MKRMISLLSVICMFFVQTTFAQHDKQAPAVLSVFSESEPFELYINNVRYNDRPTNQVRIEGIDDRFVNLRVEVVGRSRRSVVTSRVELYSENGYFLDLTYSVKRNPAGAKLVLFSLFPADNMFQPDFVAKGIYEYGRPGTLYFPDNEGSNHVLMPISNAEFDKLLKSIQNEPFDDGKLKIVKMIAPTILLNATQIGKIIDGLAFGDKKLSAAKELYQACVDKYNYHQLMSNFPFSSDRNALADFVTKQQNK